MSKNSKIINETPDIPPAINNFIIRAAFTFIHYFILVIWLFISLVVTSILQNIFDIFGYEGSNPKYYTYGQQYSHQAFEVAQRADYFLTGFFWIGLIIIILLISLIRIYNKRNYIVNVIISFIIFISLLLLSPQTRTLMLGKLLIANKENALKEYNGGVKFYNR